MKMATRETQSTRNEMNSTHQSTKTDRQAFQNGVWPRVGGLSSRYVDDGCSFEVVAFEVVAFSVGRLAPSITPRETLPSSTRSLDRTLLLGKTTVEIVSAVSRLIG